jgi:hypothetical protein
MIPAALGVCFLLVWALIGGMIFRDSQLAAENERDAERNILPLIPERPTGLRRTNARHLPSSRQPAARAAS